MSDEDFRSDHEKEIIEDMETAKAHQEFYNTAYAIGMSILEKVKEDLEEDGGGRP